MKLGKDAVTLKDVASDTGVKLAPHEAQWLAHIWESKPHLTAKDMIIEHVKRINECNTTQSS